MNINFHLRIILLLALALIGTVTGCSKSFTITPTSPEMAPTDTHTFTSTATPVPPTPTKTFTPSFTPTPIVTAAIPTHTFTSTFTPTSTPTVAATTYIFTPTYTVTSCPTGANEVFVYGGSIPTTVASAGTTVTGITLWPQGDINSVINQTNQVQFTFTVTGNLGTHISEGQLWIDNNGTGIVGPGDTLLATLPAGLGPLFTPGSFTGSPLFKTGVYSGPNLIIAYVTTPGASGTIQTTISYMGGSSPCSFYWALLLPFTGPTLTVK